MKLRPMVEGDQRIDLVALGLISRDGVSQQFGAHVRTLQRWEDRGEFPKSIAFGSKRYYRVGDIRAEIDRRAALKGGA